MTRILVFGASVVAGFWDTEGGWVHRLKTDLRKLSKENGENIQVYNLGVSGHTTADLLSRMENEIQARKDEENHEIVVFISIGENDALYDSIKDDYRVPKHRFLSNFREIIDIAQEHSVKVYFMGNHPVNPRQVDEETMLDRHELDIEARDEYFRAGRNICGEKGIKTLDISEKVDGEEFKSRLFDGLHPDNEGHKKIYEVVKKHLDENSSIKIR
jgi:lysophospholipase L1-like esterase